MSHRLLILSKREKRYRALIEHAHLPDLTLEPFPTPEVDVVFGEPDLIKDALASLPALLWVQSNWAGVEALLDPALPHDYLLTNARGVFGGLMSEYVFGYLLAHERKIFERNKAQEMRHWDDSLTGTLRGKTIGLLGVGSIGREIARTAKCFNMTVRGFTLESETCDEVDDYYHDNDRLMFASNLDYLVCVLPATKATRKFVNAELISALPTRALFINAGRGSVLDETALIDALTRNRIAGAVLDVLEQEPLLIDHPLWSIKNLRLTFHTAAPSLPEDISGLFVENYLRWIEGGQLKYRVDFEKGY